MELGCSKERMHVLCMTEFQEGKHDVENGAETERERERRRVKRQERGIKEATTPPSFFKRSLTCYLLENRAPPAARQQEDAGPAAEKSAGMEERLVDHFLANKQQIHSE